MRHSKTTFARKTRTGEGVARVPITHTHTPTHSHSLSHPPNANYALKSPAGLRVKFGAIRSEIRRHDEMVYFDYTKGFLRTNSLTRGLLMFPQRFSQYYYLYRTVQLLIIASISWNPKHSYVIIHYITSSLIIDINRKKKIVCRFYTRRAEFRKPVGRRPKPN